MSFGLELKKARLNKKMTQDDLAEKLGLTVHAIRKYENDSREPSIDIIVKISDILDTPILKLLNVDDQDFEKITDLAEKTGLQGRYLKERINRDSDKVYLKDFLEYITFDRILNSIKGYNDDTQAEVISIWNHLLTDIFANAYYTDDPITGSYVDNIFIKKKFFEYFNNLIEYIDKPTDNINFIEISMKKTELLNNISLLIDKIIIRTLPDFDENTITLIDEIKNDYIINKKEL